jgi:hypothetical protein
MSIALPKLYVMTAIELLRIFLSGVIVGTKKLDRSDETTVPANDVCSITLPSHSVTAGTFFGTPKHDARLCISVYKQN